MTRSWLRWRDSGQFLCILEIVTLESYFKSTKPELKSIWVKLINYIKLVSVGDSIESVLDVWRMRCDALNVSSNQLHTLVHCH